ncbi:hypothetical protein C4Q27_23855 [Pseudomonas sp. SWI36]|nr:hypothetical protein C4Q27_23855 [Pseudomonas sp. SWI36]
MGAGEPAKGRKAAPVHSIVLIPACHSYLSHKSRTRTQAGTGTKSPGRTLPPQSTRHPTPKQRSWQFAPF